MCTCLELTNKDHYFGRTLDLEFHFEEEAVITPRNYEFKLKNGNVIKTKYALIGTAFVNNRTPLYYEAANEAGLAIAGLNFPNNAQYFTPKAGKLNLAMFEIIPYFLGKYSTIDELRNDLNQLNITNETFNENMPISPLHWMISDSRESIVVEQCKDGLHIYQNNCGVMTNNPPFEKQLDNLKKYELLNNQFKQSENPMDHCVGLNAVGLPGDFSSMSRFVKTAFLRKYSRTNEDEMSNVTQFFHILDSVSMLSGTVLTKDNKEDITFYSCCINLTEGIYYYKTYYNNTISAMRLDEHNKNATYLTRHLLSTKQRINMIN